MYVQPCVGSRNLLLKKLPMILMLPSNLGLCQIKKRSMAFVGINYSAHPVTGGAGGQQKMYIPVIHLVKYEQIGLCLRAA